MSLMLPSCFPNHVKMLHGVQILSKEVYQYHTANINILPVLPLCSNIALMMLGLFYIFFYTLLCIPGDFLRTSITLAFYSLFCHSPTFKNHLLYLQCMYSLSRKNLDFFDHIIHEFKKQDKWKRKTSTILTTHVLLLVVFSQSFLHTSQSSLVDGA